MVKLDLKDAFFSVSIHKNYRKYLRFSFCNQLYEFLCLPFGLCTAPYVFTKIMKPVLHFLRSIGIILVIYLDDILKIANSRDECLKNLKISLNLLQFLGFIINEDKCVFVPTQSYQFLGFVIDTKGFFISLPKEKETKTINLLNKIINRLSEL